MKLSKPVKLTVISALAIGAGLGAFGVVHAVTSNLPATQPHDPAMTPQVKMVDVPTPSPTPSPEAAVPAYDEPSSDVPAMPSKAAALTAPAAANSAPIESPAASPAAQVADPPTIKADIPVPTDQNPNTPVTPIDPPTIKATF